MNNIDLSRYPEVLSDLIDKAAEQIVLQLALAPDTAKQSVYIVTEIIRRDWSGSNLYLAKGLAYDIQNRDREMYGEFTGGNHKQLADKYELTVRQVYDRLARIAEEEFKRRQPGLFE
jgi:Mor family transcriptional regulator